MTVQDLEIKAVERQHFDQVIDLLQLLSDFKPDKGSFDEIWSIFQKQDHVFSVVALAREKVVAYGSVAIQTRIRGGKMGHIEDIVCHPQFQNYGIGKAIMAELSEIAAKQGCYKVVLHCQDHNVAFYKKCGFSADHAGLQRFL